MKIKEEVLLRRKIISSSYSKDPTMAKNFFSHPLDVIRASCLSALVKMDQANSYHFKKSFEDSSALVRRTACYLSVYSPQIDPSQLLLDQDSLVVEMAAWACGEKNLTTSVPLLITVADTHKDPLCREAATAALGAIGHPSALNTILARLDDKPQIRRRAVIALAAYEGPDVQLALEKSLSDRDWQVRQIAEDLLNVD